MTARDREAEAGRLFFGCLPSSAARCNNLGLCKKNEYSLELSLFYARLRPIVGESDNP